MKKNKLIYLIFTLILTFSFNSNVYAAQELTCVYESPAGDKTQHMILIQNGNGSIEIYKNKNTSDIDDTRWIKVSVTTKFDDSTLSKDSNGHLTACPLSEKRDNGNPIYFYGEKKGVFESGRNLKTEYTNIKRPSKYVTESEIGDFEIENEIGEYKGINWDEFRQFLGQQYPDVANNMNVYNGNVLFNADNYSTNCVYVIPEWDTLGFVLYYAIQLNGEKQPIVLQLAYNKDTGENKVGIYGPYATYITDGNYEVNKGKILTDNEINNSLLLIGPNDNEFEDRATYLKSLKGVCPRYAYAGMRLYENIIDTFTRPFNGTAAYQYAISYGPANILQDYNADSFNRIFSRTPNLQAPQLITGIGTTTDESCEEILGENMVSMLQTIYNLMKIGVSLVLVGLGVLDIATAVFAGDEDKMKKAQKKFIRRLIIAAIIFIAPIILKTVLNIAHEIWPHIDSTLCGIEL